MRLFLGVLIVGLSSVCLADSAQYFIKTSTGFKPVDKTEATLTLIQKKGAVLKCTDQYLTTKLTMKNENHEARFSN